MWFFGDIFYANGCINYIEINRPICIIEVIHPIWVLLIRGSRVLAEYLMNGGPWTTLLKNIG